MRAVAALFCSATHELHADISIPASRPHFVHLPIGRHRSQQVHLDVERDLVPPRLEQFDQVSLHQPSKSTIGSSRMMTSVITG